MLFMRIKQEFTVEERTEIGFAKNELTQAHLLERYLKNLKQRHKQLKAELGDLGYRCAKLSKTPGSGCKPRGCTMRSMLIEEKLDEVREIEREIDKVKVQLKKITRTLAKMPTKKYYDILIQKYITRAKTTKQISNMRYKHLDDALLEYYHSWKD